jgi:hypothetical protein
MREFLSGDMPGKRVNAYDWNENPHRIESWQEQSGNLKQDWKYQLKRQAKE